MKKKLALLLAASLMAGCLTACGGGAGASDTTKAAVEAEIRDDVVIYSESIWSSLDPLGNGALQVSNQYVTNQIYEALTYVNDESECEAVLAESWEISEDGLDYTFKLREGVKFQNGEVLTADDVVYSYNRCKEAGILDTYVNMVDSVEAIDENTVVIHLQYAFAPFLSYTAHVPVVNKTFAEANDLTELACGTGPYKLVSIDLNSRCDLTRNDDYWKEPAAIKDITMKAITEGTTAIISFKSGELDFVNCYNPSSFAELQASGEYNTELKPTFHTAYFLMNNSVAPLDNVKVRQALAHCVDRDTMIAVAYEGLAVPAYLLANTNTFGVSEDLYYNHYEYDIEKAKALLAEAGYPNGLDLGTMLVLGGSYHEKYAQIFQNDLSKAGVTVQLQNAEALAADAETGNYTIATFGSTFVSDFSYNANHYGEDNVSRYDNARVKELFALAEKELDQDQRLEYYDEAVELIFEDCPSLPIFNKEIPYAWNKDLNAVTHLSSEQPWFVYEWSWNEN